MESTNIFRWATSELSQDAFICWLMSFALKENHGKNPALESCALDLLHKLPGLETAQEVSHIERQAYGIDVLLTVGDYYVIIEDKIHGNTYDGQIVGYAQKLIDNAQADPEKIICVLYKTTEQPSPEQNVDYEFTRHKLLEIMRPYKSSHELFAYYVEYLEYLESISQLYTSQPISKWEGLTYKGFFNYLRKENIVPKDSAWNYVANKSGGFLGMWWGFCNDIDPSGIHFDSVYLQLEDNIIAVKMSAAENDYDENNIRSARERIFDYFSPRIEGFNKKVWRLGDYMTVGYVEYNEKNYREQIASMQKVFDDMNRELRLS